MSQTYTPPSEPAQKSAESVQMPEPAIWMWQHEETGLVGHTDYWQLKNGWQKQNPRLKIFATLYTDAQLQAYGEAKRREALEEAAKICEESARNGFSSAPWTIRQLINKETS